MCRVGGLTQNGNSQKISVKLTKLSNIETWLRSQKLKQNKLAKESPKFVLTYRKIVSIFVTFATKSNFKIMDN